METITLTCLLAGSRGRLGVTCEAGHEDLAKQVNRVQGFSGLIDEFFSVTLLQKTMLVLAPTTIAGLDSVSWKTRRRFLATLLAAGNPCLALAGINNLPDFLVRFAELTPTFVFSSRFDEYLLVSRLTGLLREKLQRRLLVQGALVNIGGRGVLITGVSGAGKTTLALELAQRGHQWIADDAVEIEKRRDGRLYGWSHALVKNLLEIKDIGILQVQDVLGATSIADESPVDMVVEMSREARQCVSTPCGGRSGRRVMGARLPHLKITFSNDRVGQLENAVGTIDQTG